MSLLNVWLNEDRALIGVDTDGVSFDGHAGITKVLPLAHARTVFAARGDRKFLWELFSRFFLGVGHMDYDSIVAHLPYALADVLREFRNQGLHETSYQFAIVGWSPADGRMRGRWYKGRADDVGFDMDELGARLAPWEDEDWAPIPDSIDNMLTATRVQMPLLSKPGVAGGGRLIVTEVTRDAIVMRDVAQLQRANA